jgi:hypothetical protein
LKEKLAAVLIIPSLGVPNWSIIYINTAPQSVDYSYITLEETMVVEKASGRDSPLRQGAGKSSWILSILFQRRRRLAVCFEEKRSVP